MKWTVVSIALYALLTFFLAACGGDEGETNVLSCVEGSSQPCVSECSTVGLQQCDSGGNWGACVPPEEE